MGVWPMEVYHFVGNKSSSQHRRYITTHIEILPILSLPIPSVFKPRGPHIASVSQGSGFINIIWEAEDWERKKRRRREKRREESMRETERDTSIYWFALQMLQAARAWPSRSQLPGTQAEAPPQVARTQLSELSSPASRVHSNRKLESGTVPGLEPRHFNKGYWTQNSLNHKTKGLLLSFFKK